MFVPKPSIKRFLETATETYHDQLQTDDEALKYLDSRGITSEAQAYFRIGIVRTPIEGHESFKNRLSFPYITRSGVVSMRFRSIGESKQKILVQTGDIARLYNPMALMNAQSVYICEGETDTITAWMAGLPAVGIPGAYNWTKYGKIWAKAFANREVCVLADNDDKKIKQNEDGSETVKTPGADFAQDVYRSLGGCRILMMPEGHDVSSFAQAEGLEALYAKATRSSREDG